MVFKNLAAVFLSLSILLTGHGLQLTIVPLYAYHLGFSPVMIGYTGSAYFLGFVAGCLSIPRFVSTVGHIRVFLVLAATATCALLALALVEELPQWMLARFATGWAMAGIYMVIESWLNDYASTDNRGSLLSVYTFLTLAAIAAGQLLVGIRMEYSELIICGSILLSLGAIPVGLTRSTAPAPSPLAGFKLLEVFRASHVAVVGALVAGFVTSGFWALGPLVAKTNGLSVERIGVFLAATIAGGAISQLPVGRVSDKFDRRLIILYLSIITVIVCAGAALLLSHFVTAIYAAMFLFGAAIFPMYPLCLAHANDNSTLSLIEIGSVVLLMHSVGAVIGPVVIAALLETVRSGFFICNGVVILTFSLWVIIRIRHHAADRSHFEPFLDLPRTTLGAIELSRPDSIDSASPSDNV